MPVTPASRQASAAWAPGLAAADQTLTCEVSFTDNRPKDVSYSPAISIAAHNPARRRCAVRNIARRRRVCSTRHPAKNRRDADGLTRP